MGIGNEHMKNDAHLTQTGNKKVFDKILEKIGYVTL
jgi:hypothetical protein